MKKVFSAIGKFFVGALVAVVVLLWIWFIVSWLDIVNHNKPTSTGETAEYNLIEMITEWASDKKGAIKK